MSAANDTTPPDRMERCPGCGGRIQATVAYYVDDIVAVRHVAGGVGYRIESMTLDPEPSWDNTRTTPRFYCSEDCGYEFPVMWSDRKTTTTVDSVKIQYSGPVVFG